VCINTSVLNICLYVERMALEGKKGRLGRKKVKIRTQQTDEWAEQAKKENADST